MNRAVELFAGAGEIRARCRAFDWSTTPLGHVSRWPASLASAIRIVMAAPQPMWIGWGTDFIQLYNDAYVPFSERHPASLGRPARETWPDIWSLIGPDLERVRDGGPPVSHHNRRIPYLRGGRVQELYFSFSYSAIPDAAAPHGVGGVLAVAVETTARVQALKDMRDSEARYRALAAASADVIYRMNPDWSEMRQLDGRGILSDTPEPREDWLGRYIHRDDQPRVTAAIAEAVRHRRTFESEHRVIRADGTLGWTLSRAVPVLDEGGGIVEWVGTASEITTRKDAEAARRESQERQTFLLRLGDALRPLADAVAVQRVAAQLLGEQLGANQVHCGETVGDVVVTEQGYDHASPPMIGRFRSQDFGERLVATCRAGQTAVCEDVTVDPTIAPAEAGVIMESGFRAYIAVPLMRDGAWAATLAVHSIEPRSWTTAEIALVEETATRTWAAVERVRAEAELSESEERYRTLFDSIDQGYCTIEVLFDADGEPHDYRFLEANPAFARQTGLVNAIGRTIRTLVPDHEAFWYRTYGDIALTGVPRRFEHRADALGRFFDVYAFRIGDPSSRRVAVLFQDITERKRADAALRDSEARQAFLLRLSDTLRPLAEAATIQAAAAQLLGTHLGVDHALYFDVAREGGQYVHVVEYDHYRRDGSPSLIGRHALSPGDGSFVAGLTHGEPVVLPDFSAHVPETERAAHLGAGVQAMIIVPLLKDGEYVAGFAIASGTPRKWTTRELALTQETAERTWATVQRARAEDALQRRARLDAFRVTLNDALRHVSDADAIQETAAAMLGRELAVSRVLYYAVEQDAGHYLYVVQRDFYSAPGLPSMVGRHPQAAFGGDLFAELARGRSVAVSDVGRMSLLTDTEVEAYRTAHIAAFLSVPLLKNGDYVAGLVLLHASPRRWTEEEMTLVQDTAERTWAAVERAAAEAQLRLLNEELEDRVRTRTAEINSLFTRLVRTQEEERRRIARDIHDQLGQTMTALRMNLEALRLKGHAHPAITEQTVRTQKLAEEVDHAVDFLTWDLRPPALDLGLGAAVRSLVTGWSQRFSIAADVILPEGEEVRLEPDAEANLYRLVQEALHNVLKHAQATHVAVVLERRSHELVLVVEDDGRGFDVSETHQAPNGTTGLGLVSMRERATLAGGHLEVESVPGAGTSIFVRIPLAEEDAR